MTYVTWRIDHVPFVNNSWNEASRTTLTSFYDPSMSIKVGEGKDSFNFKQINFNNAQDNLFNPQDKLYIYRAINTDTINTTTDILMTACIKDLPYEQNATSNSVRVEAYNFSETLMNAITFVDAQKLTIPNAIYDGIMFVSRQPNFAVTWDENNPLLNSSGQLFPVVGERYYDKSLKLLIEKYSSSLYTQDGNYYWWIDQNNVFKWRRGANTTLREFNYYTTPCKNIKIKKDVSKVKNYLIMKGGSDPANKQIQTKVYDASSINKHGRKWGVVISQNNSAKELIRVDLAKAYPTEDFINSLYPTFPFTTAWVTSLTADLSNDAYGTITINYNRPVTINQGTQTKNEKAYCALIRAETIKRLESEGKRYLDLQKYGLLQVDIAVEPGSFTWGLADRITFMHQSTGIKELRVVEIQYTNNMDVYSLEEDVGSL